MKQEVNDLFILIESLKKNNFKGFKRTLIKSSNKNKDVKYALFQEISRGGDFDKNLFISKHLISQKQFSHLKFQLFQEILNFLKVNYDEFSDISLQNDIIEFEILLHKGLYIKSTRKYKRIKNIALEKCDYSVCCTIQIKAIEHQLYNYTNPKQTLKEASSNLRELQVLSDNLISYKLLLSEVLNEHYNYMDRRAENSDEILNYLAHPLLQSSSKALSVLALFYYYRIKATIFYGNNQYQKTKEYSLKAYHHLNKQPSEYRNDYLRNIVCLNNYIDSSFYLLETSAYEIMYPQMIDIVGIASKISDTHSKALIFQILCTLKLNYLWIKRDIAKFYEDIDEFIKPYLKYEPILRPNFKLEIIINMAKMYVLAGDLESANEYCNKIDFEKSNPASSFVSCLLIMRIMINFDLKNYQFMQHLVSTSKYYLIKRNRFFDLENISFKYFGQIKQYHSTKEQQLIFDKLYEELLILTKNSKDLIISNKIDLLNWVKQRSSYARISNSE